ncbi:FACT complex subunit SSRP1-like [Lissotriton helveticus]
MNMRVQMKISTTPYPKPPKKTKVVKEKKPRKEASEGKRTKDANVPKRHMSAYMIWLNASREKIKSDNPGISIIDLSKKAGEPWKGMYDDDKEEWDHKAEVAKKDYEKAMKVYKESGGGADSDSGDKKEKKSKSKPDKKADKKPDKKADKKTDKSAPSKTANKSVNESFKSNEFVSSDESSSDESGSKKKSEQCSEEEEEEILSTPPNPEASGSDEE